MCKKGGKLLLVVIIFLLAVLDALAAPISIFDDAVVAGSTYNTSVGAIFSIAAVPPYDRIAVELPGEAFVVENNSCSKGRKFRGCYSGAAFKEYNYSLPDRLVYEFSMVLELIAPDIVISKAVDKPTLEVGEETSVRVNITNVGMGSGSVYYHVSVPLELKIVEVPDQLCELSYNNTLRMVVDIGDGEFKACHFKLRAMAPGTYPIESSAEFDAVERERVTASSSVEVKELPLFVNVTMPAKALLGDMLNLSILLSSNDAIERFFFMAFIPAGIKPRSVDSKASAKGGPDGLNASFGGSSEKLNGSVELMVGAQALRVGNFSIGTDASWRYGSISQALSRAFPLIVEMEAPYLRLAGYDSKTGIAEVDIVNPSHVAISNISVSSKDFSGAQPIEQIASLSHAAMKISLGASQDGNYTGRISYQTPYVQKLEVTSVFSANFTPVKVQEISDANITSAVETVQDEPVSTASQVEDPVRKTGSKLKAAAVAAAAVCLALIVFAYFVKSRKEKLSKEGEKLFNAVYDRQR